MRSLVRAACAPLLFLLLYARGCESAFRVVAPALENDDPLHGTGADGIPHALVSDAASSAGSIAAPLVLPPLADRKACSALNRAALAQTGIAPAGIAPTATTSTTYADASRNESIQDDQAFVLLVELGECPAAAKTRYAQQIGAAGVVLFDAEETDASLLPVAQDTVDGIEIPTIVIRRRDALRLIELMRTAPATVVQLSWDKLRATDQPVEVALWFTSRSAPAVRSLIDALGSIVRAFDSRETETRLRVHFRPHYDVYDGSYWGCGVPSASANATSDVLDDRTASVGCDKLCVYNRKFCTYDPEWNEDAGLDGKDVLNEDVRQLCVAQYALKASNSSAVFWDYVAAFNRQCSAADATPANGFNAECSRQVLATLSVPVDTIDACVNEQGESLLAAQVAAKRVSSVVSVPQLTIDNAPLHVDSISCAEPISLANCTPLRMVCSELERSVAPTALPRACSPAFWDAMCPLPLERDDCGECSLRADLKVWNRKCAGCDGVPRSGKDLDECGVCGGTGSFDVCGLCLPHDDPTRNKSCVDCKGVPNGASKRDPCGVCDGRGSFDACGLCLDVHDPRRQHAQCRVVEDPDAVKGKVEIAGVHTMAFRGELLAAFQHAIGAAAHVSATEVLLKSVVDASTCSFSSANSSGCVEVFFFVPCRDDACRASTTARLQDPSASLIVAMAMRAYVDKVAFGLDEAASIEHVRVHSVASLPTQASDAAVSAMQADASGAVGEQAASYSSNSSTAGVVLGALCFVTLVTGFVALRARDNRIRREFQQMFAAYTPLTSLDHEDDRSASFPGV